MDTNKENLTPQESLNLITMMINQAKGNVRDSSFYYLFWGWVIVLADLGVFTLLKLGYAHAYTVWLIVLPAWIITIIYSVRRSKSSSFVPTHLGRINTMLWVTYGIFACTLPFLGGFINYQINPVILMVGGMAATTSGSIIRFKPLMFGGLVLFLGGVVSFFIPRGYQELLAAFSIALGYLVPGYMLKSQK